MKVQTASLKLPNAAYNRKSNQQPVRQQSNNQQHMQQTQSRRPFQVFEPKRTQSKEYQSTVQRSGESIPIPSQYPSNENNYLPTNINLSNNGIFSEDPLFTGDTTLELHSAQQLYFGNDSEYQNPFNTSQQYAQPQNTRNQNQFRQNDFGIRNMNSRSPVQQHVTPDQLNSMTVEQILATANNSRRNNYDQMYPPSRTTFAKQQQPYFSMQQQPQPRFQQQLIDVHPSPRFQQQNNNPTSLNPSASYENMIENKVFSMLNNYFQQPPKSPIQQQQQKIPAMFQTTQKINHNSQLDEIKQTTSNLQSEISGMRKFIEDLSMSVTEKDAEIIKLRMHLGDERIKQQPTRTSGPNKNIQEQQNQFSIAEHDYQDLIEENSQLRQNFKEMRESHLQEIKHLQETLRNSASGTDSHSQEQEQTIQSLKDDCFRMQDEVQKALKIHKANKVLQDKNTILKKEMERLKQEQQNVIEEKDVRLQTMQQQISQMQSELTKAKHSSSSFQQANPAETARTIELQNKIEQLTIQMNTSSQQNNNKIEELKNQLTASQNEKQKLQDQILALSSKQDSSSQGALQQIKEENAQMEASYKQKLKQFEQQVQEKSQLAVQIQTSMAQLADQIKEKDIKIADLDKKLQTSEKTVQEGKKTVDGLGLQINKMLEQIMDLQTKEATQQKEIAQNKQVITKITEQMGMMAAMSGGR